MLTTFSTIRKKPKEIWIIEDNPDHWVLIQAALRQCLPQVKATWLPGLSQTLDYCQLNLKEQPVLPDLIFLDWYLPKRDQGLQLLQSLKAPASPLFKVPVVVLSVSTDQEDINQTYSYGCASYVIKPQRLDQWIHCLQTMTHYWWNIVTLPPLRH